MQGVATASADTFAGNRARGAVAFDVHQQDGVTRRRELHESGSLRVRFPSPEQKGLSAVFVNTAGGVAGGDIFDISIAAGEGASLTVTTAAAEKIYRSHGPDSQINVTLRCEADSHIAWLPQETILFDQVRIVRKFDIDLAETASLLLSEIVVFGRTAMNETVARGSFTDRWRLRRGGKLIFADTVKLDGDFAGKLASRAIANGSVAIGTALIVPGDELLVEKIREAASGFGTEMGVSAWNGLALVRFCGGDAARLRADMITTLACISPAGLPRLWPN
ncbi:MAG: urease accessory protein UreD [Afipia sp.]|nr:urease accessory protein UreD [Afipia sp.]